MRPHPRRARTNATDPAAWGTSDRGGWVGNHRDLQWQMQWAGTQLINTRILCYADELDVPQRQLGTIILPPDPVSVIQARPEPYPIDEVWPVLYEASTTGENDALPLYLEKFTFNKPNHTVSWSLETSTINMNAATS